MTNIGVTTAAIITPLLSSFSESLLPRSLSGSVAAGSVGGGRGRASTGCI